MASVFEEEMGTATKQLLIGVAWWSASSVALYIALAIPGSSALWYAGWFAALFYWYKFGKILLAHKPEASNFFKGTRNTIFFGVVAVVCISALYIGREALRVIRPSIGTCWAGQVEVKPVACWSDKAKYQTIATAQDDSECPSDDDYSVRPDLDEWTYHCMKEI